MYLTVIEVYCFLLEGNIEEPNRVVDSTGGQLPLKSIALCHAPRQAVHRTHMRQPVCNKNKKKSKYIISKVA